MNTPPKYYKGEVDELPDFKVFIEIKHLEKGYYRLVITNHHKIIANLLFKKGWQNFKLIGIHIEIKLKKIKWRQKN